MSKRTSSLLERRIAKLLAERSAGVEQACAQLGDDLKRELARYLEVAAEMRGRIAELQRELAAERAARAEEQQALELEWKKLTGIAAAQYAELVAARERLSELEPNGGPPSPPLRSIPYTAERAHFASHREAA